MSAQIFMMLSIPPRRYVGHVSLVSSTCEPYNCIEEEWCDALVEECDAWKIVVDPMFVACMQLYMVSSSEFQREYTCVYENLVKREC